MPTHNFEPLRGRLVELRIESAALRGNTLGDPHERSVAVYLPPDYDAGGRDYPLFVALAGFTGSGLAMSGWRGFGETLPQRVDRLVADGAMGPSVFVMPDAFTSLGGNQYVDSPVLGDWELYLVDELLPRIEDEFRVRRGRDHRAVFGKSSGGYGAMIQGMKHADRWGAIASHSGDAGFEQLFLPEFPKALDALSAHGGDPRAFVDSLRAAQKIRGADLQVLMTLAMAASYAPEADAPLGIRLPVDPHTCELDLQRWARWLAHDPVRLAGRQEVLEALRSLRCLYFDCGSRDQYFSHYGNRALARKLAAAGVPHVYEEFPDDHSGIDYRLDRSLPLLYRAIS